MLMKAHLEKDAWALFMAIQFLNATNSIDVGLAKRSLVNTFQQMHTKPRTRAMYGLDLIDDMDDIELAIAIARQYEPLNLYWNGEMIRGMSDYLKSTRLEALAIADTFLRSGISP